MTSFANWLTNSIKATLTMSRPAQRARLATLLTDTTLHREQLVTDYTSNRIPPSMRPVLLRTIQSVTAHIANLEELLLEFDLFISARRRLDFDEPPIIIYQDHFSRAA